MPTENRSSEMVSVPRDLAEEIASALCDHDAKGLTALLQVLLDKPAEQRQGEPLAYMAKVLKGSLAGELIQVASDAQLNPELYDGPFAVFQHTDPGEVERLRAHLDVALKALGSIDKALTTETFEGIDHDEIVQAIHGDDWVMNPCTQGHLDVGAAGGTAGCYKCDEHITAETTREAFEQWNATHPPRK